MAPSQPLGAMSTRTWPRAPRRTGPTTSSTRSCPLAGGGLAHIHTREEEAFYVIRGDLEFLVGDERVTVGPGTFLNVPKGTKHQFHNASDQEAEMIFWFAPAGIEGLFRELGENPQDIVAIGKKYGVEYFFD